MSRLAVLSVLVLLVVAVPLSATTHTVSTAVETGANSIRDAIDQSNANPGSDVIVFHAAMAGRTIHLLSDLPTLTDDGTTINGDINDDGKPDVALSGDQAQISNGLSVSSANNVINGLCINYCGNGIYINGSGAHDNVVTSCYLGTNLAGSAPAPNDNYGLYISYCDGITIGGTTAKARNVISGNYSYGLYLYRASNTTISSLYCGLDATGSRRLGNTSYGINAYYSRDLNIGAAVSGCKTVLSGNFSYGAYFAYCLRLNVVNTYVGTNAAGSNIIPNSSTGLYLTACHSADIGGTATLEGNLISGNSTGVSASYCFAGPDIVGNKIGTNLTGTTKLGNTSDGVYLGDCTGAKIGGTTAAARNIISGNQYGGIELSGCSDTIITGNYVGVSKTGKALIEGGGEGITLSGCANCTVGGATSAERNVVCISGSTGIGVSGQNSYGNDVFGNFIGYGSDGTTALPCSTGVSVTGGARYAEIGGSGKGNRILSDGTGIYIYRAGVGNKFVSNRIGAPIGTAAYGSTGIDVSHCAPRLDSNLIFQQSNYGIYVYGVSALPVIVGNTVRKGGYGVHISNKAQPNLGNRGNSATDDNGNNTFTGNSDYDIYNVTPWPIKAEGNTFVSTSAEVIDARCIYDQLDDASYGRVDYTPLKSGAPTVPAGGAMTLAAVPTRAGGAEIVVNLSSAMDLTAEVKNVAGRTIRLWPTIDGRSGTNTLLWDGKSSTGLPVPAGTYLVAVTARGASGAQQVRATRVLLQR